MTIETFFDLFPVSRVGIARMLSMPVKRLYNIQHRDSLASYEELALLNESIKELSYQLSKVDIHNKLVYHAKCRICGDKFKVIDEGQKTFFYSQNGLVCDRCIQKGLIK